jgi:L-amino acid N-acyltransferase YncA
VIRPARPDDAAAIAAIYAAEVTGGTATFELDPPDAAAMARRMERGLPWLVWDEGGVRAYAYAAPWNARAAYRWTVETTIYVAADAQRRGIGRRLYAALLDALTAQGFTQAIAQIALPGPGSVALHEALGFRAAGRIARVGWKHGRWIDVGFWQRALADPGAPPADPDAQGALPTLARTSLPVTE